MRSLRQQLLRTLTLTLLAVFITQGFVLYGALVHLANSQTLLHLSHDSESVLSAIDVDGQGQLTLDEQRVESSPLHHPAAPVHNRTTTFVLVGSSSCCCVLPLD